MYISVKHMDLVIVKRIMLMILGKRLHVAKNTCIVYTPMWMKISIPMPM
jgi:hypothetical protein